MKWKFVGYKGYRLKQENDFGAQLSLPEIILVNNFNKNSDPAGFLNQIVGHPRGYLTSAEQKIAMSVIQWFGTNVGRGFHETAMREADQQAKTVGKIERRLKYDSMKEQMRAAFNLDSYVQTS